VTWPNYGCIQKGLWTCSTNSPSSWVNVFVNFEILLAPNSAQSNFHEKRQQGIGGKLKLSRRLGRDFDGDTHESFTYDDRNTIRLRGNTIYQHRTARVNYTTYDVRRSHDTVNPRSVNDDRPATNAGPNRSQAWRPSW
jgi:hypothetical protein